MTENFPSMKKEKDVQVQKAHRVPNEIDPKRPTRRNIIIKMQMVKSLKPAKEKQLDIYKGTPIRLSADC